MLRDGKCNSTLGSPALIGQVETSGKKAEGTHVINICVCLFPALASGYPQEISEGQVTILEMSFIVLYKINKMAATSIIIFPK